MIYLLLFIYLSANFYFCRLQIVLAQYNSCLIIFMIKFLFRDSQETFLKSRYTSKEIYKK